MANKVFEKRFEDFRGVDYRSSDLTRPLNAAKQLTNGMILRNLSLSGRKGGKIAGQHLDNYYGLHNYISTSTATGGTEERLIAVDEANPWYYTSATLTITYVAGATDYGYAMTVNEATNTFRFVLTQGGAPVTLSGNPYLDLGTGLEVGFVTLETLRAAIDATANFSATLSTTAVNLYPAAILALAELSASTTSPQVITFYYFTETALPRFVPGITEWVDNAWRTAASITEAQFCTFLNKKNVVYIAGPSLPPKNSALSSNDSEPYWGRIIKYDGHGSYLAGMPPAPTATLNTTGVAFKAVGSAPVGTGKTGAYRYMFSYVFVDAKGNVIEGQETPPVDIQSVTLAAEDGTVTLPTIQAANSLDLSDSRYAQTPAAVLGAHAAVTRIHIEDPSPFATNDRIMILNRSTSEYIRDVVSAVGRDGTGAYIDISTSINANAGDLVFLYPWDGFWDHCAIVNGAQAAVNTITVENNAVVTVGGYRAYNSIVAGDTIYLLNRINGVYENRTVTSVAATTITFSGSPVTVGDEDVISANLRIRVYRTKAGGAEFYKVADVPHNYWNINQDFVDSLSDVQLGALFDPLTEERSMPPKASLITGHQGLMIAAGIQGAPNRIAPASIESPEYFSVLTPFDIESNVTGSVRAIISDNEDMLAVFKDDAYYNVVGDLASTSQVVQIVREGQTGISSQASLARVRDTWVGVGPSGFVAFKDGQVVDEFSGQVDPEILKIITSSTSQLIFRHASGINDWQNQLYICSIPAETGTTAIYPNSGSKVLVYDYYNQTWYDWSYHESVLPYGNFNFYQKRLYYPIWFQDGSALFKRHEQVQASSRKYDYADNTQKITYDFWMQWDHGDEPSVLKLYERLKVYCMQPTFFVPFVLRIRVYRDFKTTTANFDTTLTFSTTADIEKLVKLIQGYKSRALSFRFTVDTIHAVPLITGYEYEIADSYVANDLKGKDT